MSTQSGAWKTRDGDITQLSQVTFDDMLDLTAVFFCCTVHVLRMGGRLFASPSCRFRFYTLYRQHQSFKRFSARSCGAAASGVWGGEGGLIPIH